MIPPTLQQARALGCVESPENETTVLVQLWKIMEDRTVVCYLHTREAAEAVLIALREHQAFEPSSLRIEGAPVRYRIEKDQ